MVKLTKVRLEKNEKNEAWLEMVFSDGVQGCVNVQNKAHYLYKMLEGYTNPPKPEENIESPNSAPNGERFALEWIQKRLLACSNEETDNKFIMQCHKHNFDYKCKVGFDMYCLEEPCTLLAQQNS